MVGPVPCNTYVGTELLSGDAASRTIWMARLRSAAEESFDDGPSEEGRFAYGELLSVEDRESIPAGGVRCDTRAGYEI